MHWTDTVESYVCSLFIALCSHVVLALPDYTKPFCSDSNASDTAIGGVLTKEHAAIHRPIAFLSKILTYSEQNYSIHDCELLASVTCYKAWRPYIDGQCIVVLTNHKPLIHLHT